MASFSLRRLYAPEFMVGEFMKRGEIPPARTVYSTALEVAGPSIVEFFLISLIMMADTIMVSGIGPHAIAAVGIAVQPRFIVQCSIMAMNVGVTALTARRFGEGDHDGAQSCLKQSLLLSLGLSVTISTLVFAGSRQLLLFAGAQPDTIDLAQVYFRILLLGIPANCVSLTISAALRGIGHTRAPMLINMSANVVNVIFNYLLIGGNLGFPRLEVRGAAIATVAGWYVGLLLALLAVIRPHRYFYLLSRDGWRFERRTLSALSRVSSGAFLEQLCMRVGFFTYNRLVADLGTTQYATHLILQNILSLSFSVGEGMSLAAASLVGQNLGAERPDLSVVYGKCLQRMSILYGAVLMLVYMTSGSFLIGLFSDEPEILSTGSAILVVAGIIVVGQASQMIFMGCLRGAGDTMYIAVVSAVSIMLVRPLIAWSLAYPLGFGLLGAWAALLLDQVMRLLATWTRFSSGRWMRIKL